MEWLAWLAGIAAATAIGAGLGTRALIPLLRRRDLLDRPNARSSHTTPTPRGGGVALILTVLVASSVLLAADAVPARIGPVLMGTALLALVSWIDDVRNLSPAWRLPVQIVAVAIGVAALPAPGNLLQGWLPPILSVALCGMVWLWFVNLFNFMDGIDGIAGSEAAAIALGLVLTAGAAEAPVAAAILGAALGFLVWNWAPARIFMGDVGSVPLGYLLGFLLLDQATAGNWAAALILPLYFLADATLTLARRLLRGARIWQAHREHFYQRAVAAGRSHAAVVVRVIIADALLILCAAAAACGHAVPALAAAIVVVIALLCALTRR